MLILNIAISPLAKFLMAVISVYTPRSDSIALKYAIFLLNSLSLLTVRGTSIFTHCVIFLTPPPPLFLLSLLPAVAFCDCVVSILVASHY
jgi:hypothetical protein